MIKLVPIFLLFFLTSHTAKTHGVSPSLNAKCAFTLETPSNSTGIFFNEDCSIAYVLPPEKGAMEITSLAKTTNLMFCPSIKRVGSVVDNTFEAMEIISKKIIEMTRDFDPLNEALVEQRKYVAKTKSAYKSAKSNLDSASETLRDIKKDIREAKLTYDDCLLLHTKESKLCDEDENIWLDLKKSYKDFMKSELIPLRKVTRETRGDFDFASEELQEINNRYIEGMEPVLSLQARLSELNAKVTQMYNEYRSMEGATGQIIWTIQWAELIDEYRYLNSNIPVRWERYPIKEASLVANVKPRESIHGVSAIAAVKSSSIPGIKPSGFEGMGKGDTVEGARFHPSSNNETSAAFGSSLGGQIVLTLMGACPYYDDDKERTSIKASDLMNHMTANLFYTFEVAAKRGYSATYHLGNMIHKVDSKVKEGGFFSTTHANSLINEGDSTDWFDIDFLENTNEFNYSPQEEAEITKTVKAELFDKALRQLAVLNGGVAIPPATPNHIATGASRLSEELGRCWFWYCQAGSAVVGVLDSIFGSSEATSNFYVNNNSWVFETVEGIEFVDRVRSLTFY
jgi:hypothetical protein